MQCPECIPILPGMQRTRKKMCPNPKGKKKKWNMTQKLELSDRVFTAAKISILHEVKEKHP